MSLQILTVKAAIGNSAKNYSKQVTSFTITALETNSWQNKSSEMSTYLNDFYSSFPETQK